jgi:predicted ATPase
MDLQERCGSPVASLLALIEPGGTKSQPARYFLAFGNDARIEKETLRGGYDGRLHFERDSTRVRFYKARGGAGRESEISAAKTVLASYRDPADRGPTTRLGQDLAAIQIFRGFDTGWGSSIRQGASLGAPKSFLQESGGNLALILQDFAFHRLMDRLNEYLRRFWAGAEDVLVRLEGGIAQTYVKEHGIEEPIPATRLSDGTLKFLCLLAVLLHPEPPPLICIEEPELGLHPDALAVLADALREASQRCQIVVTTHSEALVNALSDEPEAVMVCERGEDGGSHSVGFGRAIWRYGWSAIVSVSYGGVAKSVETDGEGSPHILRGRSAPERRVQRVFPRTRRNPRASRDSNCRQSHSDRLLFARNENSSRGSQRSPDRRWHGWWPPPRTRRRVPTTKPNTLLRFSGASMLRR